MERFEQFDIRNRRMVSAIFGYEDHFIDKGLRRYTFKQALFLYLVKNGYESVIFYSTSSGPHSFQRTMLEQFLRSVENDDKQDSEILSPVQTGKRRGQRLAARLGSKNPEMSVQQEHSVDVSAPYKNLYEDPSDHCWHKFGINDRQFSAECIEYNLTHRRHTAIVIEASDNEVEFEDNIAQHLVTVIQNESSQAELNPMAINDNKIIVVVNANSYRNMLLQLFGSEHHHPSVFMGGYFETLFTYIPKKSTEKTLNPEYAFALPSPSQEDVKRTILKCRFDASAMGQSAQNTMRAVDWISIDDICQQVSLVDNISLSAIVQRCSDMESYDYPSFKEPFGVRQRGQDLSKLQDEIIGLDDVKLKLQEIQSTVRMKLVQGEDVKLMNKHLVFYGNPGTGKTTVARLIAGIYKDMGLITKGHLVEINARELVGQYVGQTAIKTNQIVDSALDGVLFVDEAYALAGGGDNDFGREAVNTLLTRMENDRHKLVVIFAGYKQDMENLYAMNDGIKSRINNYIEFPDYTADELKQIFMLLARKKYSIPENVENLLVKVIEYAVGYSSRRTDVSTKYTFANARWVRNFYEKVEGKIAQRFARDHGSDISVLVEEDLLNIDLEELEGFSPEKQNTSDLCQELKTLQDEIIGLESVKAKISEIWNLTRLKIKQGKDVKLMNKHLVFYGNPGTGKTTVARLIAGIYKQMGLVTRGHLVEVHARELVGEYVGHTSVKTNKVVDSALDGVLFIDEAYALAKGGKNDFGQEAVDTLLTRMENDRSRLVVILAGYKDEMGNLLTLNPGFESRINTYIEFPDYSVDELKQIFLRLAKGIYTITPQIDNLLGDLITYAVGYSSRCHQLDYNFANARWVRNFFENVEGQVASRSGQNQEADISTLYEEDLLGVDMKELKGFSDAR